MNRREAKVQRREKRKDPPERRKNGRKNAEFDSKYKSPAGWRGRGGKLWPGKLKN